MMNRNIKSFGIYGIFVMAMIFNFPVYSQTKSVNNTLTNTLSQPNVQQQEKAKEWVESLHLNDHTKEVRLQKLIAWHLKTIRDWHNGHSYALVPAGDNPETGKPLSQLDRQMIIDSSMPDSVHSNFMKGLRKDLNEEQVKAILDKKTMGKVAFTFSAYKAIVPDLTKEEETAILGYLKQAREQAIDYKNKKEISAIFEIYKTKCEQYLNAHGRNWRQLYKAYYNKIKREKARKDQNK